MKFNLLLICCTSVINLTAQTIGLGGTWHYWDQGSLPASNWTSSNYIDNSWPSGVAELGYGDNDETTIVSYGTDVNNKYPTTYFRKQFTVTELNRVIGVDGLLKRDDGAVIYIVK